MKKNDVFTFTAPNGEEVTGVVVSVIRDDKDDKWYLCYAQNRLFAYRIIAGFDHPTIDVWVYYAILPNYDELLARYNDIEVAQAETQSGM